MTQVSIPSLFIFIVCRDVTLWVGGRVTGLKLLLKVAYKIVSHPVSFKIVYMIVSHRIPF